MKVNVNGLIYSVIWRYPANQKNLTSKQRKRYAGVVQCFIKVGDDIVAQGESKKHKEDPIFLKNEGRIRSMSQAIIALRNDRDLDKEERRTFWKNYAEMRGGFIGKIIKNQSNKSHALEEVH